MLWQSRLMQFTGQNKRSAGRKKVFPTGHMQGQEICNDPMQNAWLNKRSPLPKQNHNPQSKNNNYIQICARARAWARPPVCWTGSWHFAEDKFTLGQVIEPRNGHSAFPFVKIFKLCEAKSQTGNLSQGTKCIQICEDFPSSMPRALSKTHRERSSRLGNASFARSSLSPIPHDALGPRGWRFSSFASEISDRNLSQRTVIALSKLRRFPSFAKRNFGQVIWAKKGSLRYPNCEDFQAVQSKIRGR